MANMRLQFQSNLFGTMAFTQPFITYFREHRAGHIINISSVGSTSFTPSWAAYCATKAAMDVYSDILASELFLFNVRVSTILPGTFRTNIFTSHPAYVTNGQPPKVPATKIYTDPVTQGFNSINSEVDVVRPSGVVGDVEKLAIRVYEVGAGVGLTQEVVEQNSRANWIRIPLGSDSGERLIGKYTDNLENVKAFEAIWRSTDRKLE